MQRIGVDVQEDVFELFLHIFFALRSKFLAFNHFLDNWFQLLFHVGEEGLLGGLAVSAPLNRLPALSFSQNGLGDIIVRPQIVC